LLQAFPGSMPPPACSTHALAAPVLQHATAPIMRLTTHAPAHCAARQHATDAHRAHTLQYCNNLWYAQYMLWHGQALSICTWASAGVAEETIYGFSRAQLFWACLVRAGQSLPPPTHGWVFFQHAYHFLFGPCTGSDTWTPVLMHRLWFCTALLTAGSTAY
jgi:hypothetical protein